MREILFPSHIVGMYQYWWGVCPILHWIYILKPQTCMSLALPLTLIDTLGMLGSTMITYGNCGASGSSWEVTKTSVSLHSRHQDHSIRHSCQDKRTSLIRTSNLDGSDNNAVTVKTAAICLVSSVHEWTVLRHRKADANKSLQFSCTP